MTLTAILLLLCAAGIHAGWNALGKKQDPSLALFFLANMAGTLALAPFVLIPYGASLAAAFHGPIVWITVVTGVLQVLYYAGLAGAYASGQLTVAYPLVRSSGIVMVALLNLALGRGHQIGGLCLAGIALVACGCFLLPMRAFGEFRVQNYLNACCFYALMAASGTALYTIVDDLGVHTLLAAKETAFTPLGAAFTYAFLQAASSSVFLAISVGCFSKSRADYRRAWKFQQKQAWLVGIGIYLGYGLVLMSFTYVRNVSYASAFREVGILLGVVTGWLFLHEKLYLPRVVGAVLACLGLIAVALG